MKLREVINCIHSENVFNHKYIDTTDITGISYNSKTAKQGDIFVCLVGEHTDGHIYAQKAIDNGAVAVIACKKLDFESVPVIMVDDTMEVMAKVAALLNDFPSKKMNLIGVTGTNGKTTVTHLIQSIIESDNKKCGLIGTLGHKFSSKDTYRDAKHTTPQSPEFQSTLKLMNESSLTHVAAEVSSHALEQHRVGSIDFVGAVFTNLTQDHLDYHITMEAYFKEKQKLFSGLARSEQKNKYAVINNDDGYNERLNEVLSENIKVLTYGVENTSDVMAKNIEFSTSGTTFECVTPVGSVDVNLKMAGLFSVYNVLAALCVGIAEGIDLGTCIRALEETRGVAGRFETVETNPLTIVDYAHTPDGLLNVLTAAKKILPDGGDLVCVFGCGGDRDATKRPKMAEIAENIADKIVITSDNPRTEDPQQIITDVLSGIKSLNSETIKVEIDRQAAIEFAVKNAKTNDIIVVAGKGHEDYQILKDKTIHFDDREEVIKAFAKFRNV